LVSFLKAVETEPNQTDEDFIGSDIFLTNPNRTITPHYPKIVLGRNLVFSKTIRPHYPS